MSHHTVYAFDVDGTLDSSNGPVTLERCMALWRAGHTVAIVSPSGAYPKAPNGESFWPRFIDAGLRRENLSNLRSSELAAEAARYVYVSDNGDQTEADAAGFEYVWPADFMAQSEP